MGTAQRRMMVIPVDIMGISRPRPRNSRIRQSLICQIVWEICQHGKWKRTAHQPRSFEIKTSIGTGLIENKIEMAVRISFNVFQNINKLTHNCYPPKWQSYFAEVPQRNFKLAPLTATLKSRHRQQSRPNWEMSGLRVWATLHTESRFSLEIGCE